MKKIRIIAVCILVALTCMIALAGCNNESSSANSITTDYDDIMVVPTATASQGAVAVDVAKVAVSADKTNDAAVLESAAYLYQLANENAHKVAFSASVSEGRGFADVIYKEVIQLRGDMEVREYNCNVGTTKFYEGYGYVMTGKDLKTNKESNLLGTVRILLNYADRTYSPDGTVFYKQNKGGLDNDSVANFAPGEGGYIDWESASKGTKYSAQQWVASGEGKINKHYQDIDNANILAEYVQEASITHNDQEGYYEVFIKVDPTSAALNLGREGLRKSTGSKDLDYVFHEVTMQIWDCGLMRYYYTYNSWEATIKFFHGTSKNQYYRYFTYNQDNVSKLSVTDLTWTNNCRTYKG